MLPRELICNVPKMIIRTSNETIRDLLAPDQKDLRIHEDRKVACMLLTINPWS
jgi:hypothetical protein